MRIALFIGGRSDYTGPAVRILPRTGARLYLSERWKVDDLINNNDREQQLTSTSISLLSRKAAVAVIKSYSIKLILITYTHNSYF